MSLTIDIKVNPSSGQSKITLDKSNRIVVYVKSQPEDGKANREVIKLLSKFLEAGQHGIEIMAGLTSRRKKIKIATHLTLNDLMHKLGFRDTKNAKELTSLGQLSLLSK